MAAYEAHTKNPLAPRASGKSIVVARQPQKGMRDSGHIANVKACPHYTLFVLIDNVLVLINQTFLLTDRT